MKKTLLLFAFIFSLAASAQVPQGISYQAIALNSAGNPVASSNIGLRLSILDNAATGTALYTETFVKATNAQGLFNTIIGQGTATFGTFAGLNWKTNNKFLKVEMDATGGTNYSLVGTTQLLTVPYAFAAKSLVTGPGEGIVLTSPNGTQYTVSVNDSGQLTVPTATPGNTGNFPSNLYVYGDFNNYDATTALLMTTSGQNKYIYKYFPAGSSIKFLAQNNPSSAVYGVDNTAVVLNGAAYTFNTSGFYLVAIIGFFNGTTVNYNLSAISMAPRLKYFQSSVADVFATYNVATNKFTFICNGITLNTNSKFDFRYNNGSGNENAYGDNLADGTIESNGTEITFPNLTTTPKNFRVELTINFNGSASYTITQLP